MTVLPGGEAAGVFESPPVNDGGGAAVSELPRYVEQLRILLWLQMYASLVGILVILVPVGYLSDKGRMPNDVGDQALVSIGLLALAALLLAVVAKVVRRRWWWVYVLIVVVEMFAVGVMVQVMLYSPIVSVLGILIYVALVAWVASNLFRREVVGFLFRPR